MSNAELGVQLLDSIIQKRGLLDLEGGARKLARRLARDKGRQVLDPLVISAFGRNGWMVPNQYWTPGVPHHRPSPLPRPRHREPSCPCRKVRPRTPAIATLRTSSRRRPRVSMM
jgi:hypothetical protein